MAAALATKESNRPRFGRAALVLAATSIALTVGSFFFVPWGWQLGILAAIAALAYGSLALRAGETPLRR
jgi:hypothetical protein